MAGDNMINNLQGDVTLADVTNIIRVGVIVGVKISYEAEWVSDVIEGVMPEENIVEIRLLEQFINQDLMVGDIIHCKVINEDFEYVLTGKVIDVGIHNPQRVIVEIANISKYINERRSQRYTVNLCAKVVYSNNEKATFATVKNVSSTGVSLACREFIGLGEEVDVDIVVWKEQSISVEGKVVRLYKVNNNYKYGILIESMDKTSKQVLEDFIKELEEKETELLK